jgi:WD40 repeat protein
VVLDGPWPHVVRGLAFAADGRTLATTEEGAVRFWETATGHLDQALPVRFSRPGAVRFLPGDDVVALWGERSLRLWDVWTGHDEAATTVAVYDFLVLAADGGTAAGCLEDGTVRVWDVVRGEAGASAGR